MNGVNTMSPTAFSFICVSAFLWVFLILCLLALLMWLLMRIFPFEDSGPDSAVVAAVTTVLQLTYPGIRITKIEEKS